MASFPEYFAKAWTEAKDEDKGVGSLYHDRRSDVPTLSFMVVKHYLSILLCPWIIGSVDSGRASRSTRSTRFSTSTNPKLASLLLSSFPGLHISHDYAFSRVEAQSLWPNNQPTHAKWHALRQYPIRFEGPSCIYNLFFGPFAIPGQAAAPRENILSNMPIRRGDCFRLTLLMKLKSDMRVLSDHLSFLAASRAVQ